MSKKCLYKIGWAETLIHANRLKLNGCSEIFESYDLAKAKVMCIKTINIIVLMW